MTLKTSWSAAALTETDINTYLSHTGGGWDSWTPTVTQGAGVSINSGVLIARYHRTGRLINFSAYITLSGPGAASNTVTISLPVTAAAGVYGIGTGGVIDATGPTVYAGTSVASSTTTAVIAWPSAGAAPYLGVSGFTAALASGDVVYISGSYEAAS